MALVVICKVEGCSKSSTRRGWCWAHYERWQRHGDPLGGGTPNGEPERFYREVVLAYEGDDCLPWPFGTAPYGTIHKDGRLQKVSRLVCEETNGPPPTSKHEAAHSCGKAHLRCVTKAHLYWATRIENEADKLAHGTDPRGERNGAAKITESQAREILALKGKMLQREIAAKFGVTNSNVSAIHRGEIWAWLNAA